MNPGQPGETPIWEEPVRGFYTDPGQFVALSGLDLLRSMLEGGLAPPIGYHLRQTYCSPVLIQCFNSRPRRSVNAGRRQAECRQVRSGDGPSDGLCADGGGPDQNHDTMVPQ